MDGIGCADPLHCPFSTLTSLKPRGADGARAAYVIYLYQSPGSRRKRHRKITYTAVIGAPTNHADRPVFVTMDATKYPDAITPGHKDRSRKPKDNMPAVAALV